MDQQTLLRFRLQLFGFGSVRASTGRNLQRVSFFSRPHGRGALHHAAGSHPDAFVGSEPDADLGNEGEMDRVAGRDDPDSGSSRLLRLRSLFPRIRNSAQAAERLPISVAGTAF